jgi:Reverse transcriptase (RNA-dependent DNA polymerase)
MVWYDTLMHALTDLGLHIMQVDLGVFWAQEKNDILILAVYINNCIIMSSSAKLMQCYKRELNVQYALTDLGPIHWLLSI